MFILEKFPKLTKNNPISKIIKFLKPSNFQNSTLVKLKISKISHSLNNHTSILSVLAIRKFIKICYLSKL